MTTEGLTPGAHWSARYWDMLAELERSGYYEARDSLIKEVKGASGLPNVNAALDRWRKRIDYAVSVDKPYKGTMGRRMPQETMR